MKPIPFIRHITRSLLPAVSVLLIADPCIAQATSRHDSLASLAAISGADMNFYNLYRERRDADRVKALESAEIFLSGIDSTAVHPIPAIMGDQLAEYYEKEKFIYSKAIRWLNRSMYIYGELGDVPQLARTECALANIFLQTKQFHETLRLSTLAHKHFMAAGDSIGMLKCQNLLGRVNFECKKYDEAAECFQECIDRARILRDTSCLVRALNNLAVMTSSLQKHEKAIPLLDEASRLAEAIRDTTLIFSVKKSQISILARSGLPLPEERIVSLLDELPLLARNAEEKGYCHYLMGIFLERKGGDREAAESFEEALTYFNQGEMHIPQQACYFFLHRIYSRTGRHEKAYDALYRFYDIDYKLKRQDMFIQLIDYQNELILQQEREAAMRKQNRLLLIYVTTGLSLVILVLLTFIYFRKRAYKLKIKEGELLARQLIHEKSEQEVASKNEVLEIKRLQQLQMDFLIREIMDRLRHLKDQSDNPGLNSEIEAIRNDLRNSVGDNSLKELSRFVPEFNSRFFQKLLKDFPDLSVNERRLCALLNMNMTTKQICEITRQSPHSIYIARTRLRTKLGLTGKSCSIQEFLSEYN